MKLTIARLLLTIALCAAAYWSVDIQPVIACGGGGGGCSGSAAGSAGGITNSGSCMVLFTCKSLRCNYYRNCRNATCDDGNGNSYACKNIAYGDGGTSYGCIGSPSCTINNSGWVPGSCP
jgi:hypothetical protein